MTNSFPHRDLTLFPAVFAVEDSACAAGLQLEYTDIKNKVVKPDFEPDKSGFRPSNHKQ